MEYEFIHDKGSFEYFDSADNFNFRNKNKSNSREEETGLTKEKKWEVKWADEFFQLAKEFNSCISEVVCNMAFLNETNEDEEKSELLVKEIEDTLFRTRSIEWNIQNFAQFVESESVTRVQKELILLVSDLITRKSGNLEEIRKSQFAYNKTVRQVHKQILNLK